MSELLGTAQRALEGLTGSSQVLNGGDTSLLGVAMSCGATLMSYMTPAMLALDMDARESLHHIFTHCIMQVLVLVEEARRKTRRIIACATAQGVIGAAPGRWPANHATGSLARKQRPPTEECSALLQQEVEAAQRVIAKVRSYRDDLARTVTRQTDPRWVLNALMADLSLFHFTHAAINALHDTFLDACREEALSATRRRELRQEVARVFPSCPAAVLDASTLGLDGAHTQGAAAMHAMAAQAVAVTQEPAAKQALLAPFLARVQQATRTLSSAAP